MSPSAYIKLSNKGNRKSSYANRAPPIVFIASGHLLWVSIEMRRRIARFRGQCDGTLKNHQSRLSHRMIMLALSCSDHTM